MFEIVQLAFLLFGAVFFIYLSLKGQPWAGAIGGILLVIASSRLVTTGFPFETGLNQTISNVSVFNTYANLTSTQLSVSCLGAGNFLSTNPTNLTCRYAANSTYYQQNTTQFTNNPLLNYSTQNMSTQTIVVQRTFNSTKQSFDFYQGIFLLIIGIVFFLFSVLAAYEQYKKDNQLQPKERHISDDSE